MVVLSTSWERPKSLERLGVVIVEIYLISSNTTYPLILSSIVLHSFPVCVSLSLCMIRLTSPSFLEIYTIVKSATPPSKQINHSALSPEDNSSIENHKEEYHLP